MKNVRLRPDQIERLRASGNAAAVIRHAVMRYKRGDFKNVRNKVIFGGRMKTLSLWTDPGIKAEKLRAILDAHFSTPDAVHQAKCKTEIAKLDAEIAEMMKVYSQSPTNQYRIKPTEEDHDM